MVFLLLYELLCTSIYRFVDRVSKNSNAIIMAYMTPIQYFHIVTEIVAI